MPHKPTNYTGPILTPGTILRRERLRVVRVLGQGGMAIVYEVEHIDTSHRYALKVLSAHLSDRSDLVARFLQEARVLRALRRAPHIVTLHEASLFEDNQPYLLLELLRGRTLRDALTQGRIPIALGCWYVQQLLWALAIVHHAKLVHRDVKPENIFVLDDGMCKLLDFGIVKVALESPVSRDFVTGPRGVMGTSLYMAPEHISGKVPDARADIFAAGVVLFEVLLGERPFANLSDRDLQARIMTEGFPSLEEAGGFDVPAELRAIARRATNKNPDDRYPDVAAFATDLNQVLQRLNLLWEPALGPAPLPQLSAAVAPAILPVVPTLDELPSFVPPSERRTRDVSRSLSIPAKAYRSPPDGASPREALPSPSSPAPEASSSAPSVVPPSPQKAVEASIPNSSHPPLHLVQSSTPPRWRSRTPPRRSLVQALVPRLEDFVARMFDMLTPVRKAREEKLAKVYALEARKARRVGEAPPHSQRPVSSPVTRPTSSGFGRTTVLAAVLGAFGIVVVTFAALRSQESRIRGMSAAFRGPEEQTPSALSPRPVISATASSSAAVRSPALPQESSRPVPAPASPSAESVSPPGGRGATNLAIKGSSPPASSAAHANEARPAVPSPKGAPSGPPLVLPKRRLSLPK